MFLEGRKPLNMREGLSVICKQASTRFKNYDGAVVVIEGKSGTGKSTFLQILESSSLGNLVDQSQLNVNDEVNCRYPLRRTSIWRNFPENIDGKILLIATHNAKDLKELYNEDNHFVWVRLMCDPLTRMRNILSRSYKWAKEDGHSDAYSFFYSLEVASSLWSLGNEKSSKEFYSSDILIDTSLRSRLPIANAIRLLQTQD